LSKGFLLAPLSLSERERERSKVSDFDLNEDEEETISAVGSVYFEVKFFGPVLRNSWVIGSIWFK